jgi:hypothetical protein
MLAAASPAFAQVTVAGDDNTSVQFVNCSQVQLAANVQFGDQNAAASDDSIATIANEQGVSQNAVQACFGDVTDVNQGGDDAGDVFVD